ncbi:tetratricopeptide repeat protein [Cribrihabitans neustonicus]|uniref:O-linked N-acetylglucosamine transferase, SPINDLY family protein n=1 Tax=Cribrihabitans neustonicus TaxID=1429085 RepID=UPI003B5987FC
MSKAQRLERASKLEDAAKIYRDILAGSPENQRARQALEALRQRVAQTQEPPATVKQELTAKFNAGQFDAAAKHSGTLLQSHPQSHFLWDFLGRCHLGAGNLDLAATCLNRALGIEPGSAGTLSALGNACQRRGQLEDALALYHKALEADAEHLQSLTGMGAALIGLERFATAATVLQKALELAPDSAHVRLHLADTLHSLGRLEDAKEQYAKAAELDPDLAAAHFKLGQIWNLEGKPERAAGCFARALQAKPDDDNARSQRLHTLAQLNDWDWIQEYDTHRRHLGLRGTPCAPFAMMTMEDNPDLLRVRTQAYAASQFDRIEPRPPARAASRPQRLKIGYFAEDFRGQATQHRIGALFERHDANRFEICAYAYGATPADAARCRVQENAALFRDVAGQPDSQVIATAKADQLDIAVDLEGYTGGSRARLFGARLAPLHIAYPGYPGTMGTAAFDYFIADHTTCPPGSERHFDEHLIRLPGSCQVDGRARPAAPQVFSRAGCGLPDEGFVFCCFNNTYKITPREFAIWMRLLAGAPDSVLWLLDTGAHSVSNLRRAAASHGIDPDRLVFAAQVPQEEHLGRHAAADLFLDTFAVNAGAPASDALWAGLPVLTLPGRQFAARVGASLVQAAGLPEMVAASEEEYESIAAGLAQDPVACAALRAKLQANRLTAPLFDTTRFVRTLERAFDMAHDRHLRGLAPDHLAVPQMEGSAAAQ